MNRVILATILCVLTVLAGCGAGPSDDGVTTVASGGTQVDTGTVTVATTTSDGTSPTGTDATTTDVTSSTTTDTATPGSESDATIGSAEYAQFVTALQSAGNFTATERTTLTTTDTNATFSNATVETQYRLDLVDERGYAKSTTTVAAGFGTVTGVTERYTDEMITYQHETTSFGNQSTTEYDMSVDAGGPVEPVTFETVVGSADTSVDGTGDEFDQIRFTRVGTETFEGAQVTRYEATGQEVTDIVNAGIEDREDASFSNAAVVLLIDDEGIIRYQSYVFTFEQDGTTYDAELVRTISAVGSTTVDEPDWLSKATSQSGR